MNIEILYVPDCPNVAAVRDLVRTVVGDRPGVDLQLRLVTDHALAAELGMRGSPTLLVDGLDPFADPAVPPSLSCRLYRHADGTVGGTPTVEALRAALDGQSGPGG